MERHPNDREAEVILTLEAFARRCAPAAVDLDDRLTRDISSPQEHNLVLASGMPLMIRAVCGRFPWELTMRSIQDARDDTKDANSLDAGRRPR